MADSNHRSSAQRGTASRGTASAFDVRRFLPLAVLVIGLVAFFALDLDRYLSFSTLKDHREALVGYVESHALVASASFAALYALVVAFSIPGGALLTITGGFLFGIVWGTLLVVIGATTGAIAVFLAARTALGGALRAKAGGAVQRLEAGFRENAFSYMLTLRLIPVLPFWLLNLVPAFLGVPLWVYALSTLIGIIPGTVVYVSVGNGLGATLAAGGTPDLGIIFEPAVLLPLLGLALLSLLPVAYKKLRGRKLPAVDDAAASGTGSRKD